MRRERARARSATPRGRPACGAPARPLTLLKLMPQKVARPPGMSAVYLVSLMGSMMRTSAPMRAKASRSRMLTLSSASVMGLEQW